MTDTTQKELGKTLWAIADDLRGGINRSGRKEKNVLTMYGHHRREGR